MTDKAATSLPIFDLLVFAATFFAFLGFALTFLTGLTSFLAVAIRG